MTDLFAESKKNFLKGIDSFEKSNYSEAEMYFKISLEYTPGRLSILNNLSATLIKLKKYQEAQNLINHIHENFHNDAVSHLNQGNIFVKSHDLKNALKYFKKAIEINPNYSEAYNNYGFVLHFLENPRLAITQFDIAIKLRSDYVEAYYNKCISLIKLKVFGEALEVIEKALAINENFDDLFITYLGILQQTCEWQKLSFNLHKITKFVYSDCNISSIFRLLSLIDDPQLHLDAAKKFVSIDYQENNSFNSFSRSNNADDRIRIGYYSADFYNHATSYLIAELLENHDRSKFEIFAFSFGPNIKDEMNARISNAVDNFYNVFDYSDEDVVILSRNNSIDIAVDLKGYTENCRPGIFAKRAAPIQVNYLGYPGTMGCSFMDYIIADKFVIPFSNQKYFTEKIIYMPYSYQVNDRNRRISNKIFVRSDENLPDNAFVYCCFNNIYKIQLETFKLWINILQNVKGSVLWLLDDNPIARSNLLKFAESHGVSCERIIFAKRMKLEDHLARHKLADLFIDTLPYNAHTTTSDALWSGLPVLTLAGSSFASRVSASLLNALELPELVANSSSEYLNIAINLGKNPDTLKSLKFKLTNKLISAPLFNTSKFTMHIESAYLEVYSRYIEGAINDNVYVKE